MKRWAAGLAVLLAASAGHGQRLMVQDGIELRGSARVVEYGAATCEIRTGFAGDDRAYDPANQGQPIDLWRLEFTIYNGSGQQIESIRLNYDIASESPPCTSWDGPRHGIVEGEIKWAGTTSNMLVYRIPPRESVSEVVHLLVFHDDAEPFFKRWSLMQYELAVPAVPEAARPEPPTVAQPEPSPWLQAENHPGCRLWDPRPQSGKPAKWDGACSRGLAEGAWELCYPGKKRIGVA